MCFSRSIFAKTFLALAITCSFSRMEARERPSQWSGDRFFVGCNYWASHAGIYMWRRWDAKCVSDDLDALSRHGMTMLRVFPLWPDFQPLTGRYAGQGDPDGFGTGDGDLANPESVDQEMLSRFRFLCDEADKRGMRLVVGIVTGWMSGRLFVPPALERLDVLSDPLAIQWETRFVRRFVREFRDHPAIAAWDLGNECNYMAHPTTPASAWLWMNTIASAIRLEDPSRPVVSGMTPNKTSPDEPFNVQDQGELVDVLTTHPYPLFTANCNREPFNSMRNGCHPTIQSMMYASLSGRPCFVEEAGVLGPNVASDARAAETLRTGLFTAWAHGIAGYMWWCAFDQSHLDFKPYVDHPLEQELGLLLANRSPKPQALAMRHFTRIVADLPLTNLPPRHIDAVCLLAEKVPGAWQQALGAFLLARQAGFDIAFAGAEHPLPRASFYILPDGTSLRAYSARAWRSLRRAVEDGATALVTKEQTWLTDFLEVTGNEIEYSCDEPWSTEVALPGGDERIRVAGARKQVVSSRRGTVVARDADGRPFMTESRLGKGRVVYVNAGIENMAASRSDCFSWKDPNPVYRIYAEAARLAGIARRVTKGLPCVGITEHPADGGRTWCVAVNYAPEAVACPISVRGAVGRVFNGTFDGRRLSIKAGDAAVFEITGSDR